MEPPKLRRRALVGLAAETRLRFASAIEIRVIFKTLQTKAKQKVRIFRMLDHTGLIHAIWLAASVFRQAVRVSRKDIYDMLCYFRKKETVSTL